MQIRLDIARDARELLFSSNAAFGAFAPQEDLLRLFLILPEIRFGAEGFDFS